jgi:hypothetical protein
MNENKINKDLLDFGLHESLKHNVSMINNFYLSLDRESLLIMRTLSGGLK